MRTPDGRCHPPRRRPSFRLDPRQEWEGINRVPTSGLWGAEGAAEPGARALAPTEMASRLRRQAIVCRRDGQRSSDGRARRQLAGRRQSDVPSCSTSRQLLRVHVARGSDVDGVLAAPMKPRQDCAKIRVLHVARWRVGVGVLRRASSASQHRSSPIVCLDRPDARSAGCSRILSAEF